MDKYIPKMYKRSIFEINYDKLKAKNIKCLIFDLDNTLLLIEKDIPDKKVCYLIKKLKKDFKIYILSNNTNKKRLNKVKAALDIDFVSFALKPFSRGFKKIMKSTALSSKEICIIGDQIMTDILGGNKLGIYTILVEPLGIKDLKITTFNRFLENKKVLKLEKMDLFKRGEFYE